VHRSVAMNSRFHPIDSDNHPYRRTIPNNEYIPYTVDCCISLQILNNSERQIPNNRAARMLFYVVHVPIGNNLQNETIDILLDITFRLFVGISLRKKMCVNLTDNQSKMIFIIFNNRARVMSLLFSLKKTEYRQSGFVKFLATIDCCYRLFNYKLVNFLSAKNQCVHYRIL
jgi:hypothetical protein